MSQHHAITGDASKLGGLSDEILRSFNVHGNGCLRIDQDDHSTHLRMLWSSLDSLESEYSETDMAPSVHNVPIIKWKDIGRMLEASNHANRVALGILGETGGRLSGPIQFILKLMDFWHLDNENVTSLLGFDPPDAEYIFQVLHGGWELPGRDFKDRIAHLFYIRRTLWSLFRDLEVENEWLREKRSTLSEESPISLLLEGSMENLLLVREYVESAAGIR